MSTRVDFLRLLMAETDMTKTKFSDESLEALLEHTDSAFRAAELGWTAKAAMYSALVDVSESGVDRKLSQLQRNALNMAKQFKASADESDQQIITAMRTAGVPGTPWGRQISRYTTLVGDSMLIGDVGRGPTGQVIFLEVPVFEFVGGNAQPVTAPEPLPVFVQQRSYVPTDEPLTLTVEAGRTFTYSLDYLDPTTGGRADLTGWTAQLVARPAPGAASVLTLSVGSGITVDTSNGAFVLYMAPAATSTLHFDSAEFEVVATTSTSDQLSLVRGIINVTQGDV